MFSQAADCNNKLGCSSGLRVDMVSVLLLITFAWDAIKHLVVFSVKLRKHLHESHIIKAYYFYR